MSLSKRDSPFANSGLVVTVPIEHFGGTDVLAGVRLQQLYEKRAFELGRGEYLCPIQNAKDFLANRPTTSMPACSYPRGLVLANIAELVPPIIVEALLHGLPILDRRWHGKYLHEAILVGPESRGSSPVRIVRDDRTREVAGHGRAVSGRRRGRLRGGHRQRGGGWVAVGAGGDWQVCAFLFSPASMWRG